MQETRAGRAEGADKSKKGKVKNRITTVLFVLLFIGGFLVLAYPTISDQWNTYRQSQLISNYERTLDQMSEADFTDIWEAAREYNDSFSQNTVIGDVFDENGDGSVENTEYWEVLNVAGDGIMGYITIPKINIKLGVYHGTSNDVLDTGVGHLYGSKLPIGGESNNSVLSAHRGLPSAKLFTDIDKLEAGDRFYLHILDQDLAYEVDKIYPMIPKDDMAQLGEAMAIVPGEDMVTLFTCTPYGVNTHRLLVRGHRVPYDGELESTPIESMVQAIQNYYMLYLLLGIGVVILAIVILRAIFGRKKKKKEQQT